MKLLVKDIDRRRGKFHTVKTPFLLPLAFTVLNLGADARNCLLFNYRRVKSREAGKLFHVQLPSRNVTHIPPGASFMNFPYRTQSERLMAHKTRIPSLSMA